MNAWPEIKMIVEIDIPDLSQWAGGFSAYYMRLIFTGNRPKNDTAHALLNGYIRLVEGSVRLYESARSATILGWNTHDSLMLGAFNDAATAFEASVTNMYRAATFMDRIRASTAVDAKFKDALGAKPDFVKRIRDIRRLRRAIHHLDEDIANTIIPTGMPTFLVATGDIVQLGDGQEVKKIERLQIGQQQIKFDAIAAWLSEMVQCAKRIEAYEWKHT